MATGSVSLPPGGACLPDGSSGNLAAALVLYQGTETSPKKHYRVLAFDGGGNQEHAWWTFPLPTDYSSGGSLRIKWRMASGTSTNNVKWQAKVAAMTPSDSDAIQAHAEAAAATVTTSGLATTAGRLIESVVTLTMDSAAGGDLLFIVLFRNSGDAADTLTVDAEVVAVTFEYTA
jgi:hypothetical protein